MSCTRGSVAVVGQQTELLPAPSVTTMRFANDEKSLLACASRDGTLSVFNLSSEPPSLVSTLRGHRRAVNGELSTGCL